MRRATAIFVLLWSVACAGRMYDGPSRPSSTDDITLPDPTLANHPAWLAGADYTTGVRVKDDAPVEAEDVGIRFEDAPEFGYSEKEGGRWLHRGTWSISSGTQLVLSPKAEAIDVSVAMRGQCRVFERADGTVLLRSTRANHCPFASPLSASACRQVGSYVRSTIDAHGDGSVSSTQLLLDAQGVLVLRHSASSYRCGDVGCARSSDATAPIVGTWWMEGSTVRSDRALPALERMTFTPSKDACGY